MYDFTSPAISLDPIPHDFKELGHNLRDLIYMLKIDQHEASMNKRKTSEEKDD
jgi:hypothetical protein